MQITPIATKSVADEVFEQMKRLITNGQWKPGEKIPSELELVEAFGVSRITVRQAIHRLGGMGLLRIRRGEGTFVNDQPMDGYWNALVPMLTLENPSLMEIMEFRMVLGEGVARVAAARATEEDLKNIEKALFTLNNEGGDSNKHSQRDIEFHLAVARATHNRVLFKLEMLLYDLLLDLFRKVVAISTWEYVDLHEDIYKAICAHNPEEAARLTREHVLITQRHLEQLREEEKEDEIE